MTNQPPKSPSPSSLFQSTRRAAAIDPTLWWVAVAMAFSMLLVFAAAERLNWIG
jgi:hypothetical protein